jgi:hypothetical protein
LLATWEDLEKDSDSDDDVEANLALMATTSDREDYEADSDSDDEEEVIAKLSRTELVDSLKDALKMLTKKAGECKVCWNIRGSDMTHLGFDDNKSINIQ